MFVYQLNAKLKRGLDFVLDKRLLIIGSSPNISYPLQSHRFHASDEILVDRLGQQRRRRLRRPRRALQTRFEPIFDGLIA
jgi:hypothetical protein